jgi:hypothetical protein
MAEAPKNKTIRRDPGTNLVHVGVRWWDAGMAVEWVSLCGCFSSCDDLFGNGLSDYTAITCMTCMVYHRGFM